jgi:hypothetical protein
MRVPWPGLPGAGFLLCLNLKLADSKSMYATNAACSPLAVISYVSNALLMTVAARVASAHSSGRSVAVHEAVAGAIAMRVSAVRAPALAASVLISSSNSGKGAAKAHRASAPARRVIDLMYMLFERFGGVLRSLL